MDRRLLQPWRDLLLGRVEGFGAADLPYSSHYRKRLDSENAYSKLQKHLLVAIVEWTSRHLQRRRDNGQSPLVGPYFGFEDLVARQWLRVSLLYYQWSSSTPYLEAATG